MFPVVNRNQGKQMLSLNYSNFWQKYKISAQRSIRFSKVGDIRKFTFSTILVESCLSLYYCEK